MPPDAEFYTVLRIMQRKTVDAYHGLCYSRQAMEVGLFFMPFFRKLSLFLRKRSESRMLGMEKHKEI